MVSLRETSILCLYLIIGAAFYYLGSTIVYMDDFYIYLAVSLIVVLIPLCFLELPENQRKILIGFFLSGVVLALGMALLRQPSTQNLKPNDYQINFAQGFIVSAFVIFVETLGLVMQQIGLNRRPDAEPTTLATSYKIIYEDAINLIVFFAILAISVWLEIFYSLKWENVVLFSSIFLIWAIRKKVSMIELGNQVKIHVFDEFRLKEIGDYVKKIRSFIVGTVSSTELDNVPANVFTEKDNNILDVLEKIEKLTK